ncbi:hypothetical protein J6590_003994 [Homalodisca vitripennis]|nr:hypothetical protein J6590_003994 [Homalodisca vitripennis]
MQLVAIVCMLVGVAVAQQAKVDPNYYIRILPVVERTEIRDVANQFSESYTTHDGQTFVEQGVLKRTADGLDNVLVKQGSYQYISPEGVPIRVDYTADEFGFHPVGTHLPVAPAPPAATF